MSSIARTWESWVLDHDQMVKVLVQMLIPVLLLVAVPVLYWRLMTPGVWEITTSHPVYYLPAKYELAEDVINIFSKRVGWGGAGGISVPEVKVTVQMYQKTERDTVHYLSLSHSDRSTWLHYWDLQSGEIVHASEEFDAPNWGIGYYRSYSGRINGNRLVLERKFDTSSVMGVGVLLVVFCTILWIFLGITVNDTLNSWLKGRRRQLRVK